MDGQFPGNLNLIAIPQGKIPEFLKADDVILPNKLCENFNRNDCRGLASVQFFVALNVFLGGNMQLPKNATTEFFSNLSMQALSKSNDTILLTFERNFIDLLTFEDLASNINNPLRIRTDFLNEQKNRDLEEFQKKYTIKKLLTKNHSLMCSKTKYLIQ